MKKLMFNLKMRINLFLSRFKKPRKSFRYIYEQDEKE